MYSYLKSSEKSSENVDLDYLLSDRLGLSYTLLEMREELLSMFVCHSRECFTKQEDRGVNDTHSQRKGVWYPSALLEGERAFNKLPSQYICSTIVTLLLWLGYEC